MLILPNITKPLHIFGELKVNLLLNMSLKTHKRHIYKRANQAGTLLTVGGFPAFLLAHFLC